jgi:hypothetical protein
MTMKNSRTLGRCELVEHWYMFPEKYSKYPRNTQLGGNISLEWHCSQRNQNGHETGHVKYTVGSALRTFWQDSDL